MGAQCSVFVNKSGVEMELRVFLPPARPDKYRKIIRIKPGGVKLLKTRKLCCEDSSPENPFHLMVFVDGVYTGTTLYSFHIKKYTKILGYVDNNGFVHLKGIRIRFPSFCRLIKRNWNDDVLFLD
ncbi:hypothetical protein DH2020_046780 [Rehmannia glutinosa]|uniref:Uncharacterized protein n=1 Tax=Rehmannia glutinosa TaxID=99300 RepID=A0ABR0UB01_REHGL